MSDSQKPYVCETPIDPTVAAIIRRKANRMVGRSGLCPQDRDDLEQQLTLHVLERRARFQADRGTWPAFVQRLVERAGENIVRARRAAKRRTGPLEPLTAAVPGAGDEAEGRARAVAAAIPTLPDDLRVVAELLLTETVAGAARVLGVSRATVYARLREIRVRTAFAAFGGDP